MLMQTEGTTLHYLHDTQDTARLEPSKLAAVRCVPHAVINPGPSADRHLPPAGVSRRGHMAPRPDPREADQ